MNQDPEKYYQGYFSQREKARAHKDDIIYALRVLGRSTSGKIEKYIHGSIIKELQEQIESNPWNKVKDQQNLQRVLENHKQSKRSIQDWLPKLESEGLVTKNKHYEYFLTEKGKKLDIYPDIYGRMLLSSLMNLPWRRTKEKNIVEFAKRIGIFMLYIFINNLHTEARSTPVTAAKILDKKNMTWIKDAIRSDLMFFSFEKVFLGSMSKGQRQRLFIFDEGDYYKLLDIFEVQFPRYHEVLRKADSIFSEKVIKRQT